MERENLFLETEEEDKEFEETPLPVEELTSEQKVRIMATAADSLRAGDIVALDLRELTIIADFFLICTGKSSIQIRAIADRMEERLKDDYGVRKLRMEGYQEATWVLLDYGDVVAHVMAEEQRAFYNLEAFWASAPRLELELVPEPTGLSVPRDRFDTPWPQE